MCGRYVSPDQAAVERAFHLSRRQSGALFERRFNVFPSATVAILRYSSALKEVQLDAARWGLVPHWWKQDVLPDRTNHIARLEEAPSKPMWRDAWSRARCLIPAEGWYEWQVVEHTDPVTGEVKQAKQPHFVRRVDGRLFCFAGLRSYWNHPQTGEQLLSCAVLTAAAQGSLAGIHERTPAVLPESSYASWLDPKLTDPEKVRPIVETRAAPEEFIHYKVRPLVNDAKAEGPDLVEPLLTAPSP